MRCPVRPRGVWATMLSAALVVACAGGGDDVRSGELPVTSAVVSDSTTQDVLVVAPQAGGAWPTVVALHGIGGSGQDMGELATRLARAGTVVFAPTYRSDLTTEEGLLKAEQDIVCGYRLARATAPEHGGDLNRPVAAVGWSLGANFAVLGGLSPATGGSPDEPCPGDTTPPEVVVGISGCYYEHEGTPVTWFDDVTGMANKSARVVLIAGDRDATCPAWQSQQLASELSAAGYDVDLVQLPSADHYAPVFHEVRDGQFRVSTDDAVGQRAVDVILDAIATRQAAGAEEATPPAATTVEYLPGLSADVYSPAVSGSSTPVIVLVPGGGWRSADRSGLASLAERLSAGGALVVNATYRAAEAGVVFPTPVEDILCAVSFAAGRARTAGLPPGPLIVVGHSSGAHLAALAALGAASASGSCPYPSRTPDGLAGLAGLYDIATATEAVAPLLGVPPDEAPDPWRAANAMTWVASHPSLRVLLAHGDADELVPVSATSTFATALERSGHPVQVQIVPGADHHDIYQPDVIASLLESWATTVG